MATADIHGVYVRAGFHQRFDGVVVALGGGQLQRGEVAECDGAILDHFGGVAVFVVYRSAVLDQQFDQGCIAVPIAGSVHQGSGAAAIGGIHSNPFGQQEADQCDVVGSCRLCEHAGARLVARVDVRAFRDQQAGSFGGSIVGGGDEQRRASEFGSGIDLGAFGQKQGNLGGIAGAPHERSGGEFVGGVGIGSGIEEEAHTFQAAERGGVHER